MEFWRKFNKGFFYVSFTLSIIGCMIGGICFWANADGYAFRTGMGFALFFGGSLVMMIVHSIWGMFIELCENMADTSYRVYEINKNLSNGNSNTSLIFKSQNTAPAPTYRQEYAPTPGYAPGFTQNPAPVSAPKPKPRREPAPAPKPFKPVFEILPDGSWTCGKCGVKNDKGATYCSNCFAEPEKPVSDPTPADAPAPEKSPAPEKKPDADIVFEPSTIKNRMPSVEPMMGEDWKCPICGTLNAANFPICKSCNHKK